MTTVSSPEKAALARAAGAHHVVDYRTEKAVEAIMDAAPGGVDLVVEVAPRVNAALDVAVFAPDATVAVYANNGGDEVTLPVRPLHRFPLARTGDAHDAVEAGTIGKVLIDIV